MVYKGFDWKEFKKNYVLKKYTLMLMPHTTGRTVKFSLPLGLMAGGMAALLVLLSCTTYFAYGSYCYQKAYKENGRLKKANTEQEQRLAEYGELSIELASVTEENETLKTLNAQQAEQIEELSLVAEDTMKQIDLILEMENELRAQLGFEPIQAVGGPADDSIQDMDMSSKIMAPVDIEALSEQFSNIQTQVSLQTAGLYEIHGKVDYLSSIPTRWPVDGGNITSYFGGRENPFGGSTTENHGAIDIALPAGSPIYAAGKGTVTVSEWQSGYGYTMVVDHGYGYSSRYSHCSKLLAEAGDTVEAGQQIGLVGSTGRSTGSHLDFRVRYEDNYIDPLSILRQR